MKIYDVINFGMKRDNLLLNIEDMINMIKLPYVPYTSEFIYKKGSVETLLAMYYFSNFSL